MRRVLRIALITVAAGVTLVVAAVAVLFATLDDADYRRLASYLVERTTGRTMIVDGRFALYPSLHPSLVMSKVRVTNPPWASGPDLAQIDHVEVEIALRPLLSGTLVIERLILNDAIFALERNADGEENWAVGTEGGDDRMFGRLVPIFGTVRLRNVEWRYRDDASGRDTSVQLASLTHQTSGAKAQLDGDGVWDGQQIAAKGTFGTLAEALEPTRPFPVNLSVALPGLDLSMGGTIAEPAEGRGLDLHLVGHAADIAQFAHLLDRDAALEGPFDGEATLGGDLNAVHVTDLRLSVGQDSDDRRLALQAVGTIGAVRPDGVPLLDGIALQIRGALPTATLSDWLGRPLPDLRSIRGRFTLGGTSELLNVSAMRLEAGDEKSLALGATGDIEQLRPSSDWSIQGADLQLEAKADDLAALEPVLGVSLPQLGASSYAGRLSGETGKWQLAGTAQLGKTAIKQTFTGALEGTPPRLSGEAALTLAGLELSARGTIADLATGQGLDLQVAGHTDDVARFLSLLGHTAPPGGRLDGEAALSGDVETMHVADLRLSLDPGTGPEGQPALEARGTIGTVHLGGTPPLDGIALQVRGATSTAALSGWLGRPLPDLGPIQGQFMVHGTSEALKVEALDLQAGAANCLTIGAKGGIEEIRLAPDLAVRMADLQLDAKAPDPAIIGAMLDTSLAQLGAMTYAGRLSGGTDGWALAGKAHVGRTEIDENLTASFDGPRPRISGKLSTPVLQVEDFGIGSKATSRDGGATRTNAGSHDWGSALAALKALDRFDLDLTVAINQVVGTGLTIGRGEVDLTLDDGVLRVSPARFDLVGGTALLHLTADAHAEPPRFDLSLDADDIELGKLHTALGETPPMIGELASIVKLHGEGEAPAQLLASLDGEASVAIQRGEADLKYLSFATADVLTWLLAGADVGRGLLAGSTGSGRTEVDCLAGRFAIAGGIATAQSLLMKTPLTLSTATGTLNLIDQTVDLSVRLKPTGVLFSSATTYRVQGPMEDPSINYSKVGFVVHTLEGLARTPFDVLGSLLPLVDDGGADKDNPCLH